MPNLEFNQLPPLGITPTGSEVVPVQTALGVTSQTTTGAISTLVTNGAPFQALVTEVATLAGEITFPTAQIQALVPQYTGNYNPTPPLYPAYTWINQEADPRDFNGYDNTGVHDMTTILNTLIQQTFSAGNYNYKFEVVVPIGKFLIGTSLNAFLTGGTSTGRSTCIIRGSGTTYSGVVAAEGAGTLLIAGSKTLPVIAINAGFGTKLLNFGIYGGNTAPGNMSIGGSIGYPIDTQSDYLSSGYSANLYGPQCGVAIDPYNVATMPTGGYSGATYNQNVGIGSSDIEIKLAISNCVVGVASAISGSGQQADDIHFNRTNIAGCDTAIVNCSPNAHSFVINGGEFSYLREMFNNISWAGGGGGNPTPAQYKNRPQLTWMYRVFSMNSSGGDAIVDVHAETLRTIGTFGTGVSTFRSTCTLLGNYKLQTGFGSNNVNLPPLQFEGYTPIDFSRANISLNDSTTSMRALNMAGSGDRLTVLNECSLPAGPVAGCPPHIAVPYNQNFGSAKVINSWVCNEVGGGGYFLTDDGSRELSFQTTGPQYNRGIQTWRKRDFAVGATDYKIIAASATPTISLSISGWSINSTTGVMSFTYSGNALQVGDDMFYRCILQGVSTTQNYALTHYISAVSGTTYTATPWVDPIELDYTFTGLTSILIAQRQWYPVTPIIATLSSGSTAVTLNSGTCLLNGDWLSNAIPSIPNNTRVVSGGGTTSIVLNNAATASGPVLFYFNQAMTPQQAAAPGLNPQTANYTGTLADINNIIGFNGTSLTYTIPVQTSVVMPYPAVITLINYSTTSSLSLATAASGSLTLMGSTTTGTRTIAAGGVCNIIITGINNAASAGGPGVT